jgi:CheY-like chemotaxis protein
MKDDTVDSAPAAADPVDSHAPPADVDRRATQRDEFLATLAHELRNPLSAMRYAVDILYLEGIGPRAVERARGALDRQLAHMVRLVDDLLDASRINTGRVELRRELVDLAQVVREAIEITAPQLDRAGHELLLDLPETPVPVDGDPARLTQVLVNLLGNAAQYTPARGHVTIALGVEDRDAVVHVRDDGIGIDGEALPRLFEMFAPAPDTQARPSGGFGIGLGIARRLVEDHGGTIVARSGGLGRGSEFEVRLPLSVGRHPFAEDTNPGVPAPQPRRLQIVVADDNEDAAAGLQLVLGARGHEVFVAYDGVDAVELADRVRPDAIVLDIGMPRLTGLEACRAIRSRPWARDIVIIAVTGWGQAEDLRRSFEAGFDHHVVKPCDGTSLSDLLERPRR